MNIEVNRRSAYTLTDEITTAARDMRLTHRILDAIFEQHLEESELDKADYTSLRMSYDEISWRLEILMDYIFETKNRLEALEPIADRFLTEFTASDSANGTVTRSASLPSQSAGKGTEDILSTTNDDFSSDQFTVHKVLDLLTDAAKTGRVNSKALLEVLQTVKEAG